jgi:hypothetical protein
LGGPAEQVDLSRVARTGTGEARIVAMRYSSTSDGGALPYVDGPFVVTLEICAQAAMVVRNLALTVYDAQGSKLINTEIASQGLELSLCEGRNLVRFCLDRLHLNRGVYMLGWWMGRTIEEQEPVDAVLWGASFEVVEREPEGIAYPWAIGPVSCRFSVTHLRDSVDA